MPNKNKKTKAKKEVKAKKVAPSSRPKKVVLATGKTVTRAKKVVPKKKKALVVRKTVKKATKKTARKTKGDERGIKNLGGFPLSNGVFVRGDKGLVIAMVDRHGKVEVIPFQIRNIREKLPLLFLPFLRGATIFIESVYYSLKVLLLKRRFVKKGLKSKTKFERATLGLNRYMNYIILFLLAIAFFDYLVLRIGDVSVRLGGSLFYEFLASLISLLIFFFISLFFIFDKKNESELFRYHGAEHMVLDGAESRIINEKCSVSLFIWSIVFLAALVTFLKIGDASLLASLGAIILFVLVSFSLSYEVMRIALGSGSNILRWIFIEPFSWMQYLFIQDPEKKHLEVVKMALEELKKIEKR